MDDGVFAFKFSMRDPCRTAAGDRVESLPDMLADDQIRNSCFILQGYKRDPLCRAGALPKNDQAGHADITVVGYRV